MPDARPFPLLRRIAPSALLAPCLWLGACATDPMPPAAARAEPARPLAARGGAVCTQRGEITPFAQQLLDELNLLRTQPARYAEFVEAKFSLLNAQGLYVHGGVQRRLTEGRAVVDETLRLLRAASPLPPLRMASCLSRAAEDHRADRGPKGLLGHIGSDGSTPWQRVQRYAAPVLQCGDYLSYTYEAPRDIVMQYLVDDGVPTRGHRTGILDPGQRSFGAAFGPHARWQTMAVLMLCREDVQEG